MSLMTSLSVGVTGLKTAQTGVNTTAHNLANVNTEGYTRQEVINVDRGYNTTSYSHISYNQIGLGTEVASVKQNRNVFYDKAYRLERGRLGFYDIQNKCVSEVENLMGELQGAQFQNTLSDLWGAVEDLILEPDSIVKRTNLINTSSTFLLRAQDVYSQLTKYQENLNGQVKAAVKEVNEIGDRIRDLNRIIVQKESGMEKANDYRDERNRLIDKLSEYANISYYEDIDGRALINIEGTQFVTSDYVYHLETSEASEDAIYVDVVWSTGQSVFKPNEGFDSEKATDVGKIKALLIARGDRKATYVDVPDETASKDVIDKYNATIGSSILMSTQATFDKLVHAVTTAINDALSPNTDGKTIAEYLGDRYAAEGANIDTTITFEDGTTGTLDENVVVWDESTAAVGMDEDRTPGAELFSRQSESYPRYQKGTIEVTLADGSKKEHTVYVYIPETPAPAYGDLDKVKDKYGRYSIEQLEVNKEVKENPSKLPITSQNLSGNADGYDSATCERLSAIWREEAYTINPNVLTKHNLKDYYQAFIGNIATVGNEFNNMQENQDKLVDSIEDNRQSVSGVSSDEQLTYLVQFQYAYTASSRYISTVDQMLEHLLTSLG